MKCPCINCITLAVCQNRKLFALLKKCSLFNKYIVKTENSKGTVLHMDRLIYFCNYMNISLEMSGRNYRMTYKWEVDNNA